MTSSPALKCVRHCRTHFEGGRGGGGGEAPLMLDCFAVLQRFVLPSRRVSECERANNEQNFVGCKLPALP